MHAHSAIPRHALVSLLVRAERAAAEGDQPKARALLSDLHWFAHSDGQLHRAMHDLEAELARSRGDSSAARGQVLPRLFARAVSFFESLGPSHEVVQSVEAPPDVVYEVISQVARYAEWNPWVTSGEGTAGKIGDEVVVLVKLGKRTMRVGHRVLVAAPGERFGWCDLGWFTPLASGRRLRWIEPFDGGSRLVSQIRLYGPFARVAWLLHGASIRKGMAAEASALATRATSLAGSSKASSSKAAEARGASPRGCAPASAPTPDDKPLAGKTCVITGPTRGIGRPTALALGELGARVLLLCRDTSKGESLARDLRARGAEGVVVPVDLSSLKSVQAAAERVHQLAPRLDVLVNNAGVLNHERRVTLDGFEECFGVNFLAHFLLTNRLLPALQAAPSARIVHVSSNTHPIVGRFDFTDANWERRPFLGVPAYAHTKLAILLFNRSLARRLAGTRVRSNSLHPGIVATGMGTSHPRFGAIVNPIVQRIFLTPEEGAMTTIHVATSPAVESCQGEYFVNSRIARPGRWARDDVAAERLYGFAESLLAERGFARLGRAA